MLLWQAVAIACWATHTTIVTTLTVRPVLPAWARDPEQHGPTGREKDGTVGEFAIGDTVEVTGRTT